MSLSLSFFKKAQAQSTRPELLKKLSIEPEPELFKSLAQAQVSQYFPTLVKTPLQEMNGVSNRRDTQNSGFMDSPLLKFSHNFMVCRWPPLREIRVYLSIVRVKVMSTRAKWGSNIPDYLNSWFMDGPLFKFGLKFF